MKNYTVKIIVRIKSSVKDIKGDTLKNAIESIMHVKNLTCCVGNYYVLNFRAHNQVEALNIADKISQELLSNEVIETYEIIHLDESKKSPTGEIQPCD